MEGSERPLTHTDAEGHARMVDVGAKAVTRRTAAASAFVRMSPETLALLREGRAEKGDVLATARIAGIAGAKRTSELVPLCHPLPLTHVVVDLEVVDDGVRVTTRCETEARTGVEMEALTAAAVAALTLYDMLKAAERGITIESVRLEEKDGGSSGRWSREGAAADE